MGWVLQDLDTHNLLRKVLGKKTFEDSSNKMRKMLTRSKFLWNKQTKIIKSTVNAIQTFFRVLRSCVGGEEIKL